jgi:putative flippase GtrA
MELRATIGHALRFGLVGCVNTAVGFGVTCVALYALGVSDVAANVAGYGVGIPLSYTLNKSFTFGDRRPIQRSLPQFLGVLSIAYGFNLVTVVVVHRVLAANVYLAQALGTVVYTSVSFALSLLVVFSPRPSRESLRSPRNGAEVLAGRGSKPPCNGLP